MEGTLPKFSCKPCDLESQTQPIMGFDTYFYLLQRRVKICQHNPNYWLDWHMSCIYPMPVLGLSQKCHKEGSGRVLASADSSASLPKPLRKLVNMHPMFSKNMGNHKQRKPDTQLVAITSK